MERCLCPGPSARASHRPQHLRREALPRAKGRLTGRVLLGGEAAGPTGGLCGRWGAVVPCPGAAVGRQRAPAGAAACAVGSGCVSCPSDPTAEAVSFAASPLQPAAVSPSRCRVPRAPRSALSPQFPLKGEQEPPAAACDAEGFALPSAHPTVPRAGEGPLWSLL